MITILIGIAVGAIVGFYVGREWAEVTRAQHDMRKTWRGRRGYRD